MTAANIYTQLSVSKGKGAQYGFALSAWTDLASFLSVWRCAVTLPRQGAAGHVQYSKLHPRSSNLPTAGLQTFHLPFSYSHMVLMG